MSSEISDILLRDVNSQRLDRAEQVAGEHEENAVQTGDVAGELATHFYWRSQTGCST